MTTFATGRRAEAVAAEFLTDSGFEIIQHNYRSRYCEIDIIATKSDVTYFVEVKFRRNEKQGSGLEYITPRKLAQMQFAAEYWLQQYEATGLVQLAAIEISGSQYRVTHFIPELI